VSPCEQGTQRKASERFEVFFLIPGRVAALPAVEAPADLRPDALRFRIQPRVGLTVKDNPTFHEMQAAGSYHLPVSLPARDVISLLGLSDPNTKPRGRRGTCLAIGFRPARLFRVCVRTLRAKSTELVLRSGVSGISYQYGHEPMSAPLPRIEIRHLTSQGPRHRGDQVTNVLGSDRPPEGASRL
jgi:hypothetical protein